MDNSVHFRSFQCTSCDGKGWYYVSDDGIKRNPTNGKSLDDFYKHECNFDENDCGGVGFRVVYNE